MAPSYPPVDNGINQRPVVFPFLRLKIAPGQAEINIIKPWKIGQRIMRNHPVSIIRDSVIVVMDAPSFMRIVTYSCGVPIPLKIKKYPVFIGSSPCFRICVYGLANRIPAYKKAYYKDQQTFKYFHDCMQLAN